MTNIRSFLNWSKKYHEFDREERNLAAIFYHVLLLNDNLRKFLNAVSCQFSIVPEEMGVYFEYAYLRDLWSNIKGGNSVKREVIYKFLKPSNIDELEEMSTYDFNKYFGAVPSPSREVIQSPSKWSISRYKDSIKDDEEFFKICKFKWAFNAKPDIVIHTDSNNAICIECKFESGEGTYPTNPSEITEFQHRNLPTVMQTSLQKYIMQELLGIKTQFVFLVQKGSNKSDTHTTLMWKDAFSNLALDNCPIFIKEWIKRL